MATNISNGRLIHPQHDADITSLLYQKSIGRPHGEGELRLGDLLHRYQISESEQAERLGKALEEKEKHRKAKLERENPPFIDSGIVISEMKPLDVHLTFTRAGLQARHAVVIDEILAGDLPAPDFRTLKLHRVPWNSEKWHSYLIDVATAISERRMIPKKTAILFRRGDRLPFCKIQSIDVSNPPMRCDPTEFSFVRGSEDQSEKDLKKLVEQLRGVCAKRDEADAIRGGRLMV